MPDLAERARAVGAALQRRSLMLATAESCTGGAVAYALTAVPGSSAWLDRGFVAYSNEAKRDMLGVSEETLAALGAVSEAAVREMALGALERSAASVSVAISGVAGPGGGSPEKPVGTVWIAWALASGALESEGARFAGDREAIRQASVERALEGLLDILEREAR